MALILNWSDGASSNPVDTGGPVWVGTVVVKGGEVSLVELVLEVLVTHTCGSFVLGEIRHKVVSVLG